MEDGEQPKSVEDQALEEFPNDIVGGVECQSILHDWFGVLRARASTDARQYQREVWEAVSMLTDLRLSMSPLPVILDDNVPVPPRIWAWPQEHAIRSPPKDWLGMDENELDAALASYVRCPWLQHDRIDGSAINALIFAHLQETTEHVRCGAATGVPNWSYILSGGNILAEIALARVLPIVGFFLRWMMLPAIAIALDAQRYHSAALIFIGIWALYVLYRLIMIPAWWRLRKARRDAAIRADELFRTLLAVWGAARGRTINPSRLKELVIAAEARGAVFRPVLHTLIDRAIQRDPTGLATG
jgi:hypothetical protein